MIDPSRPPTASVLGLLVSAAIGGAVLLAVSVRLAGLEITAGALQLTVALQTVGIVALLAAAASAVCLYRIDGRAPGLYLTAALVVYAVGVLPLGGLASSLSRGPAAVLHDEVVCLLVTAVVVALSVAALRDRDRTTVSAGRLAALMVVVAAVGCVVVVVVDRVVVVVGVDLGAAQVGLDLAAAGLWLGLAGVVWRRRSISSWLERGALVATGFVVVRVMDAASVDVEGSAAHLGATLVAACLAAIIGVCALAALAEAIDAARRSAEATARGLDEATDKILVRDARSEELHHDVVNALSGLQAALTLASSDEHQLDAPTRQRLLAAALNEVVHLEQVLVRGTQGRLVAFDAAEVIGSVVETRRAQGLVVEVLAGATVDAAGAGARMVVGRPGDVAAVVHNLLMNAHVHATGAPVWIDLTRGPDHVEVSVRDGGPGIDPDLRARVFERGVRGSEATDGGSGLGLYVARELMRDLGGDLEMVPTEVGCHMRVTLVAESAATRAAGQRATAAAPARLARPRSRIIA